MALRFFVVPVHDSIGTRDRNRRLPPRFGESRARRGAMMHKNRTWTVAPAMTAEQLAHERLARRANARQRLLVRAFTIIDVLSIKIIDGKFTGRALMGCESRRRIVRSSRGIVPRRFCALVPIPKGAGRSAGGAVGHRPLFGLGPWVGAPVAPPQSRILRPVLPQLWDRSVDADRSVPSQLYRRERERLPFDQLQHCQPAGVWRSRPARSSGGRRRHPSFWPNCVVKS